MAYKTLIVDGMNVAFKQFLKLPPLETKRGVATSTIYGFFNSLNNLYTQTGYPSHVLVTWDSKESLRKQYDSDYKANRKKEPDDAFIAFKKQVKRLKQVLPTLGIPSLEVEGYEADDVIAVCASRKHYHPLVIASGDNDLYQCLRDGVTIYNGDFITRELAEGRFGFPMRLFYLWKAVVGCQSDNVKGIHKWGEKKMRKIMEECRYKSECIVDYIDAQGRLDEFNRAFTLTVLPYDDKVKREVPSIPILEVNRKKLAQFLYDHDIERFNAGTFMRRRDD